MVAVCRDRRRARRRARPRARDARRARRRQQLGRDRGHRRPARLQGPDAAEHHPRPLRADGRDQGRPRRARIFTANNLLIGEGHNQYVDDAFTSPDGRLLYVGRPSLADVVAIDLGTRKIVWRMKVDGLAPITWGSRPTARGCSCRPRRRRRSTSSIPGAVRSSAVSVRRPAAREQLLGRRHAHLPCEHRHRLYAARHARARLGKGEREFQIVDARSLAILARVDIGKALADNGFPGYSSAVRPMALSPDERLAYLQLSFLHGFVEFDLERLKPLRVAQLPLSASARALPREAYLLDSAHHGIAMSRDGRSCASPARCPTTQRSSPATISPTSCWRRAASRTGRRTAPTAATASCRRAATTR